MLWLLEVMSMNAPHPIVQDVLDQAAGIHIVLRRADYVARLTRLGQWLDLSNADGDNMARDEESRLRIMRAELDPDGSLWAKHAPLRFQDKHTIHTFKDFTGNSPVTVEWARLPKGPQVIAVVVETTRGPKTIHNDLSAEALARYQAKCEEIASREEVSA
jgi:hypothetical protein